MTGSSWWQHFGEGREAPMVPLELALPDGAVLRCERLLRWLPGKRAVFAASLGDEPVCAKWFAPAAQRQCARERHGWQRLQRAGVQVPGLRGEYAAGGVALRLYRWVAAAGPLFDGLQPPPPLAPLLDLLQQCYRAGLWPEDLHPGNFLQDAEGLYLVDAGSIAATRRAPLAGRAVASNLGLLVAQFRSCDHAAALAQVLAHGVAERLGPQAEAGLARALAQRWRERRRRFWRKLLRPSTAIVGGGTGTFRWLAVRRSCDAELQRLLAEPESLLAQVGRQFAADGRQLWVQEFAPASWLRPLSPALQAWQQQHWLPWEGVPALRPVAVLYPARRFPARPSWLVSELPGSGTE